jgi:hypothetical protein
MRQKLEEEARLAAEDMRIAERELAVYVLDDICKLGGSTVDIIKFWEVKSCIFLDNINLKVHLLRRTSIGILYYSVLQWMLFRHRHPQLHVSVSSHQAKRLVRFVEAGLPQNSWRYYSF